MRRPEFRSRPVWIRGPVRTAKASAVRSRGAGRKANIPGGGLVHEGALLDPGRQARCDAAGPVVARSLARGGQGQIVGAGGKRHFSVADTQAFHLPTPTLSNIILSKLQQRQRCQPICQDGRGAAEVSMLVWKMCNGGHPDDHSG